MGGGDQEKEKVSFSFGGKTAKKAAPVASALGVVKEETEEKNFITSIDDTRRLKTNNDGNIVKQLVIPCPDKYVEQSKKSSTENKDLNEQKEEENVDPGSLDDQAARAVLEDLRKREEEGDGPSIAAIPILLKNRLPGVDDASDELEMFKRDVAQRPDVATLEEYDEVPVSQFGTAMLRGMGWEEGKAIGGVNKGLAEPVELVPRRYREGLGAKQNTALKPGKRFKTKKIYKQGDQKEDIQMVAAPTEDGRTRNIKGISEALVKREVVEIRPGGFCCITRGRFLGFVGRIVKIHLDTIDVRLGISGSVVTVPELDVKAISEAEYKKARGQSGEDKHSKKREKESSSSTKHKKSKKKNKEERSWLASNIRVRIVSQSFKKGKYFNHKVKVMDVVTPTTCNCLTDSGSLLEGLKMRDLETLIPKSSNGVVQVVRGKYIGRRGQVKDKSSKHQTVAVHLSGQADIVTLGYDDVCEYVGPLTGDDW